MFKAVSNFFLGFLIVTTASLAFADSATLSSLVDKSDYFESKDYVCNLYYPASRNVFDNENLAGSISVKAMNAKDAVFKSLEILKNPGTNLTAHRAIEKLGLKNIEMYCSNNK